MASEKKSTMALDEPICQPSLVVFIPLPPGYREKVREAIHEERKHKEQKPCLKGSPEAFSRWLVDTQDIVNMDALMEAISCENYLRDILQPGDGKVGVKGYKLNAFKDAAVTTTNGAHVGTTASVLPGKGNVEPPNELICPISHVLMTDDPVFAADGHTYERAAITAWFEKKSVEIEEAKKQLASGSVSRQAQAIAERGVLSPMTNEKMTHLELTSNHGARNMARDFEASSS